MKQLGRNQSGLLTIEASMVFPIIVLSTVCLLFVSMFIYQSVTLYYAASVIADREAFNWDNSNKNFETGGVSLSENGEIQDGLYWKMFDDNAENVLSFLFNKISGSSAAEDAGQVDCGANSTTSATNTSVQNGLTNADLAAYKLHKAASHFPTGAKGYVTYTNLLIDRTISVCLEKTLRVPSFLAAVMGKHSLYVQAQAKVADPVDFIRTINLMQNYLPRLQLQHTPLNVVQQAITSFTGRKSKP